MELMSFFNYPSLGEYVQPPEKQGLSGEKWWGCQYVSKTIFPPMGPVSDQPNPRNIYGTG
jgi:hypothetical protein